MGQGVTLLLQFIYRTFFIQTLGLTYLSVRDLFVNILNIFSFAELGIGQAITFSLYKPIKDNDEVRIRGLMELYKKAYCWIGIAILCIGAAFMPFLQFLIKGNIEAIDNLYLIYLFFVTESGASYFFSYRTSYVTACQQQYLLNLYGCIFSIAREVIRITLIMLTKQYIPVLAFSCAWTVIQYAWYHFKIGRLYPYIKNTKGATIYHAEKETIFKNIKALIIHKIGAVSLNATDSIIISSVVGLGWVGVYSNYSVLVNSVSMFISILFSSLTASIGNLNAFEDKSQKYHIFNVINLATFWVYSISAVCFLISLTPTVSIWLGSAYTLDFLTVCAISINIYIAGMLFAPFNYRQTMGLFIYGKWRPIISAIINIIVSVVLGKYFGLKGVLIGTAVTRLTTNVWYDPYIIYKKGFERNPLEYYLYYALYFTLFVLSCFIGMLIAKIYVFGGIADILLRCAICFVLLSGLYCIIFCRTKAFRYLTEVAKRPLKSFFRKR